MKEYKVNDIIKDVRITLDHNDVTTALTGLGDVDTLSLDAIIKREIVPASRACVMVAPRQLVDWKSVPTTGSEKRVEYHYMSVPVPSDYMRFGGAKLSNWMRPINWVVGVSDDEYEKQWSKFAGIRATSRRPVCAIVEAFDGGNEFQLFACTDDSTIEMLTYAPEPTITTKGSGQATYDAIDYHAQLYEPMVMMVAAHVAEVLKDSEKSNQMMAAAKNLLTTAEDAGKAMAAQSQQQG